MAVKDEDDNLLIEFRYAPIARLLEEAASGNNTNSTTTEYLTETEIIRSTLAVYGSIFVALFLVFLFVRPRYPHVYNLKKSFPEKLHAPVAENAFGRVSWMWNVFSQVTYEEIRDQCGMDAMTTIRLLEAGVKLSLVGVFNSIFLFPIYSTQGELVSMSEMKDPMKEVSLSNLAQGHHATIACTISAYILFGAAMYIFAKDFEWFTAHRHNFLSQQRVQNYSIFLSGLPPEMQNNRALKEYFATCFSHDAVNEIHVALNIPNLEKKVAKRGALIPKLEHAINVQTVKGETPMHKKKMFGDTVPRLCGGEKLESVPTYTKEIEDLNKEIETRCKHIQAISQKRDARPLSDGDVEAGDGDNMSELHPEVKKRIEMRRNNTGSGNDESLENNDDDPEQNSDGIDNNNQDQNNEEGAFIDKRLENFFQESATVLKSAILGGEDGEPRNAAFVTFADITSANIARQTIHQREPWSCVPVEPPMPDAVNWKNVGKSNHSKQLGELLSFILTVALCIFWTIPVSFVASLSNVEGLTELLPFLKEPVENYTWFSTLLALLAPLLLVVFVSLLPMFILMIIKFEGLIELETYMHPSLFSKFASFTILQTFFISTIASTLFSSLQEILNTPSKAFVVVAEALPAQAGYFIQIICVQNFLSLGLELLRISPVTINLVRNMFASKMGHNLTEKERGETFMGLRPLNDPEEYYFARELGSKIILLQMVLYVYACMSPVTAYFTLMVFGLLTVGFRNQFIYIYPISKCHGSGGNLWINFQWISVICMIVAETLLFLVLLLKESFAAAILMTPLIVSTVLFHLYYNRRHYSITKYLPLGECATIDRNNKRSGMIHESFEDAYLHPALQLKRSEMLPENFSEIGNAAGQGANPPDEEVPGIEPRLSSSNMSESSGVRPQKKKKKKHKSKQNIATDEDDNNQGRDKKSKKKTKKGHHPHSKERSSSVGDSTEESTRKSKKKHSHRALEYSAKDHGNQYEPSPPRQSGKDP